METTLYREQYDFEWEQRGHLLSAVSIPIAAITAMATAAVVVATEFEYATSQPVVRKAFLWSLAIASLLLFAAVFLVIWSLVAGRYQKLPSAPRLLAYEQQLRHWCRMQGLSDAEFQLRFEAALNGHYATAAGFNARTNLARGNRVLMATQAIAVAIFPLSLAGACHVVSRPVAVARSVVQCPADAGADPVAPAAHLEELQ